MDEYEYLGQIQLYPSTAGADWNSRNWAHCDGRLLPIAQYNSLFFLLGGVYGGDNKSTFALPDLRNLETAGVRYFINIFEGAWPAA